jgi:hypothetical protein
MVDVGFELLSFGADPTNEWPMIWKLRRLTLSRIADFLGRLRYVPEAGS